MINRDALAREMFETVCDLQLGNPLVDLGQRLRITDTCADIALRHIEAAYKQGWNDREADILERADSMGLPNHIAAARAEALEEAAKRCEFYGECMMSGNAFARSIRALMEPPA